MHSLTSNPTNRQIHRKSPKIPNKLATPSDAIYRQFTIHVENPQHSFFKKLEWQERIVIKELP
jgi:hypothetical protein